MLTIIITIMLFYLSLNFAIFFKLKFSYPEFWGNIVEEYYEQYGKFANYIKFFHIALIGDILFRFAISDKYPDTSDKVLINLGKIFKNLHFFLIAIIGGYLIIAYIISLYWQCKVFSPQGFSAVGNCLIEHLFPK